MEILNSLECQYNFEGCNKKALGLYQNKWACGKCILKFEEKMKKINQKILDIVEQELKDGK